ncbi:MAG: hypothetical protein AAFP19_11620 [Bacteroidota bacterium]
MEEPRQIFQQLNTLYIALLSGQLLLALVVVFLIDPSKTTGDNTLLYMLAPLFSIGSIIGAYVYSNWYFDQVQQPMGLEETIQHYRQGIINRAAMLDGGNIIMIIFMMMTNEQLFFLVFFATGMLAFLLLRPSKEELIKRYPLTERQEAELANL